MTWFKNLRTATKLMLAFCSMALVLGFVGYEGLSAASTIDTLGDTLYERHMLGLSAIKQAIIARITVGRDSRSAILSKDAAEAQSWGKKIDKSFASVNEELDKAEKTLVSAEGKAKMRHAKELIPQYQAGVNEVVRLAVAGDTKGAMETMVKSRVVGDEVSSTLQDISEMKERLGQEANAESQAVYSHARNLLLSCISVAVVLFIGFGYFIAKLIATPLTEAVGVLDQVAEGDLTVRLDLTTTDEVGRMAESLNRATEAMRTALSEVRQSAESMSAASTQLASSSEELASGAQEQASSLQETTATLEELTSTVKQNADNAKQANQVASASREVAERGGQVVSQAVEAMGQINASSKSIVDIITTIDEIAFQTNLLALNAAVEAARAGEQGRGFAVVATEVRNLAQRSATSAKEIKRLIQDSVHKVENGSTLVTKSGENLCEIVGSVKKVTDIVAEIAAASREQSVGIEQVSKAMQQMDQVTQTNSSQTEELSATAQSLSAHARQLQALVERFKVERAGRRQAQSATTASPKAAAHRAAPAAAAKTMAAAAGAGGGSSSSSGETQDRDAFQEF